MQDLQAVFSFIVGEIPFFCLMAFLIYVFWIKPKREEKRFENNPEMKTQFGDEILFKDGMVGIITKNKNGFISVESGSRNDKYIIKEDYCFENISAKERSKEAYKKLSLWKKLLYKI